MIAAVGTHASALVSAAAAQVLHEAEKGKKMAERKDYYAILGIARDATPRDVKQVTRAFLAAFV